MDVQFFYANGKEITLYPINRKKYRGALIQGSEIGQSDIDQLVITAQEFQNPLFNIGHWFIEVFAKIKLSLNGKAGLRLEALLHGEMCISVNGKKENSGQGNTVLQMFHYLKRSLKRIHHAAYSYRNILRNCFSSWALR